MASSHLLPELFAGLVGDAFERFLRLDPNSPRYLAPLAGKVIALRLLPFGWRLALCPGEKSMQILHGFEGNPAVTLAGSPLAFARMGLSDSPRRALFAGEVTVEGDMDVARRFQSLFERLSIDWEALLARQTGVTLASGIMELLRDSRAFGIDTLQSLGMNIAEYWQEESRQLPAKAEADIFFEEVDNLRADFDRLEAKILRLQGRLLPPLAKTGTTDKK